MYPLIQDPRTAATVAAMIRDERIAAAEAARRARAATAPRRADAQAESGAVSAARRHVARRWRFAVPVWRPAR